jgi:DNA-binding transcriptional LysR family regulator
MFCGSRVFYYSYRIIKQSNRSCVIDDDALEIEPIAFDQLVVVTSPDHPWAKAIPTTPQALAENDWVLRDPKTFLNAIAASAAKHRFWFICKVFGATAPGGLGRRGRGDRSRNDSPGRHVSHVSSVVSIPPWLQACLSHSGRAS